MAQELKVHANDSRQTRGGGDLQRARRMPVPTPFDEIERLFDELMPSPLLRRSRLLQPALETRVPSVDVLERDEEILLRAEVPGMRKEDLDITVDENSVTLRGNVLHEEKTAEGDYYRREIAHGEFARVVTLPSAVDTGKAHASLSDGVLELVLPKLDGAKRRKIEIK